MNPNEKGKELVKSYLEEGYDMKEALLKAQQYCIDMTIDDKENTMFWATTGIHCYLAICKFREIKKI